MASTAALSPSPSSLPPPNPLKHFERLRKHFFFTSQHQRHKRHFPVLALASSTVSLPINVDYLEKEFSGHGVNFEGIGDNCVLKMGLDNGSVASLMLPSGLITSYKPYMWHGATFEVLHTVVSEGENGEAIIQGGLSMDFKFGGDSGMPWSPSKWSLQNVRGSPDKAIQVELVSVAPKNMVEVKCLVTLQQKLLSIELIITNPKLSALELSGSFLSHLKVSTPDATYTVGLQGSNYHGMQPAASDFSIIPPNFSRKGYSASKLSWAQKALQQLLSRRENTDERDDEGTSKVSEAEDSEGEEDDDYSHMTEKMSRIYTNAPREFTVIDRGRRNSVIIQRSGLDEFYVLSPGSDHEWYGKYSYICLGPSALLKPVVLDSGVVWQGAMYLRNPNL